MTYTVLFAITLLCLVITCKPIEGGYNDSYLSPKTTNIEKGIAAIYIVLHHLSQHVDRPSIFLIMGYVGFILVAVFYFISGYGLMYGLRNKDNYLQGFLKKRVVSVILPYWLVNTAFIIVRLMQGEGFTPQDIILSFLGFDTIIGTWFVTSILIMYLLFWAVFTISQKIGRSLNTGLALLTVAVLIYCVCCYCFGLHTSWTASVGAFLFGCCFLKIKEPLEVWLRKHWLLKILIATFTFGILFVGRLALAHIGIDNELLHFILRNVISVSFIVFILCLTQKIEFLGRIFGSAGKISYELYIVHWALLSLTSVWMKEWWYSIALMAVAVLLSLEVKRVSDKCLKILLKK